MRAFKEKKDVPALIGALDGSHFRISYPKYQHVKLINKRGFHYLVLQGVCRKDARFIHCYAGWSGSVHDARVLRNSCSILVVNCAKMVILWGTPPIH